MCGDHVKTKDGIAVIIEKLPKPNKYFPQESYEVKLENPDPFYHQPRTHFYNGKPVHYDAGILFFFEDELELIEFKQGVLF